MKIGILSMQMVDNMGSVLQAYGLKNMINRLGHEVSFIDIQSNDSDNALLEGRQLDFNNEYRSSAVLKKLANVDVYLLNRIKNKKGLKQQNSLHAEFRSSHLFTTPKPNRYDVCVIGADEVFNCMNSGSFGFTSQLFGAVDNTDKVITYAASCGATQYSDLPAKVLERIQTTFCRVSAFSVRDRNTYDFVNRISNKRAVENLDPVLINDFSEELSKTSLPKLPEKYCVVYSYYNRIHRSEEIRGIKQFCKKHGLKIIALGGPQYWTDVFIPCTPFECLKIFENAKFVFTDTFHGTIFATKYASKFAVMTRPSNFNKLNDLVKRLYIENHLITSIQELENCFELADDKKTTYRIIEEQRRSAYEYLSEQL